MRRWRQWLVVTVLFFGGMTILFGSWIGVAMFRASTDDDAGAVALNTVLIVFMAIALVFLHRAMYRWFWHVDRKRAMGVSDTPSSFGAEPTAPPPQVRWPWSLKLRHLVLHAFGIAMLLYIFLPYQNQITIGDFVVRHSAGRASAGPLASFLFAYLPVILLVFLSMLLLSSQMRRRDAGLLSDREKLLLSAEMNWLFSYAAAFAMTMLLCRVFGEMIMRYV